MVILGLPARSAIVQNAYVVRDLEEACTRFSRLLRIGPFVGGSQFELASHVYRGRPADPVSVRGVFVQSGSLNIELLQVLSPPPSAFHDMFSAGEAGFHHSAEFCEDYEQRKHDWTSAGYAVASEFTLSWGAKICYIDARRALGHMIELYAEDAVIRDMYRQAREAPLHWSGSPLIIPWE
jgi:hypothetical protein